MIKVLITYFCKFNKNGEREASVPSTLVDRYGGKENLISDGYIEISDEDYQYYVGNRGQGNNGTGYIRDSTTGKPISAPTRVITLEEQANALKAACDTDIEAIDNAIDVATKNKNTERIGQLQEMRQQRIQQYANELEELTNA